MACAHAKFTGEVGVCLATSGPGAIHLLNGLYDAKLDHQPVVAIVGQQARAALGGHYQQEVDLLSLFKDVAHEYVQMATTPEQIRHLVDRAVRIARAERTVTCIIIPNDLQELDAVERRRASTARCTPASGYSTPRVVPAGRRSRSGGRRAQRRQARRDAGRRRRAAARPTRCSRSPTSSGAGVAKALLGKAARARRSAVRDRLDRPARHASRAGT